MGREFSLHSANLSFIPGIPDCPLNLPGVAPKLGVAHITRAAKGIEWQDQNQAKISLGFFHFSTTMPVFHVFQTVNVPRIWKMEDSFEALNYIPDLSWNLSSWENWVWKLLSVLLFLEDPKNIWIEESVDITGIVFEVVSYILFIGCKISSIALNKFLF